MKEALSVAEFESAYDIGHTRAAEIIASGELPTYRVGRRRYISRRAAEEWQSNLERGESSTKSKKPVAQEAGAKQQARPQPRDWVKILDELVLCNKNFTDISEATGIPGADLVSMKWSGRQPLHYQGETLLWYLGEVLRS